MTCCCRNALRRFSSQRPGFRSEVRDTSFSLPAGPRGAWDPYSSVEQAMHHKATEEFHLAPSVPTLPPQPVVSGCRHGLLWRVNLAHQRKRETWICPPGGGTKDTSKRNISSSECEHTTPASGPASQMTRPYWNYATGILVGSHRAPSGFDHTTERPWQKCLEDP